MEQSQLLRLQSKHRSSKITNEVLKGRHVHVQTPTNFMNEVMLETGLNHFSTIKSFKIDPSLINALVERWSPETHTFHLPCGECTITLEDVAIQLGLNINGLPVTGPTYFDWRELCAELLGKVPEETDMKGCELKLTWLKENFYDASPRVTDLQKQQYCRANILILIGSVLMPDKSNSLVHLMYLPLLRDLRRVKKYSWGAACLSYLYQELCRASKKEAKSIGGCLLLLQSWAWYRFPMLAPAGPSQLSFPYATRWTQRPLNFKGIPHRDLPAIRSCLDHMNMNEFNWMPYRNSLPHLGPFTLRHSDIWKACVPLICFSSVVWHQVDRVKLQFGMIQDIPQTPMNMDDLHDIDKRGNHDVNWANRHAEWINIWQDRKNRLIDGEILTCQPYHTEEYMRWYLTHSRPYLSADQQLNDPRRNLMNVRQSFFQGQSSHETMYTPARPSIFQATSSHETMYTPAPPLYFQDPSANQSMYTPGPQLDFGVYIGTPHSAHEYNHHLSSNQHLQDNQGNSPTLQEHVSQEEELDQPQDLAPAPRHYPRRNRHPRPYGTGHHLGK